MEDDKTQSSPPESHDIPQTLEKEETYCSNSNNFAQSFDVDEIFDEAVEDDVLVNCSPINVFATNVDQDTFYSNRRLSYGNEWPGDKSSSFTTVVGAGLANLGNTCFLNAVLQCFIHTVPLLQGMLSDTVSVKCECNKEKFCLLCSLLDLIEVSLTLRKQVVYPSNLVDNLSYFSLDFQRSEQEDAHEFLQCFLDRLERSFNATITDKLSLHTDNLVKQVFGGRLVSKLKCCNCGHCSDTYEPSIDLSLEIKDADSLLTALQSFTKVEKLDDPETKFTCDSCKEQVSVEKQLTIDQVPSVAVFHLKRFETEGNSVQKIGKPVSFPKELDLLPFTSSGKKDDVELKYTLYAILVHTGPSSTSGHYYCFIRLSSDMWCKFDDSRVVQVPEDYVMSKEAYILFYAKEDTPWFSSYIETQKWCTDKTMSTSPKSVLEDVDTSLSHRASEASSISKKWTVHENEPKSSPRTNPLVSNKTTFSLHRKSESSTPTNGFADVSLHKSQNEVSPSSPKKVILTPPRSPSPVNLRRKSNSSASTNGCLDVPLHKLQKKLSPGLLNKVILTPPRSPSPELYREDPPDAGFSILTDKLKLEQKSYKRKLVQDDFQTKTACSYIKKNMNGLRGKRFLDAMRGSQSEGSMDKKRSRIALGKGDNSVPRMRPLVSR